MDGPLGSRRFKFQTHGASVSWLHITDPMRTLALRVVSRVFEGKIVFEEVFPCVLCLHHCIHIYVFTCSGRAIGFSTSWAAYVFRNIFSYAVDGQCGYPRAWMHVHFSYACRTFIGGNTRVHGQGQPPPAAQVSDFSGFEACGKAPPSDQ